MGVVTSHRAWQLFARRSSIFHLLQRFWAGGPHQTFVNCHVYFRRNEKGTQQNMCQVIFCHPLAGWSSLCRHFSTIKRIRSGERNFACTPSCFPRKGASAVLLLEGTRVYQVRMHQVSSASKSWATNDFPGSVSAEPLMLTSRVELLSM